ncbi:MAG: hypothetical protein JXR80_02690 [Deltaproteobacteria bacterium]|nr:hypothetical protein [Deltaproteobacteria bacterium]
MKKIIAAVILALVVVWGAGIRTAGAVYMDPVTFFAVDDDTGSNDDSVTLDFSYTNWGGSVKLQYSLDNASWTTVGNDITVNAGNWQSCGCVWI